jgi:hypothetical protein
MWRSKPAAQVSAFAHALQGYRQVKVEQQGNLWVVTGYPRRPSRR